MIKRTYWLGCWVFVFLFMATGKAVAGQIQMEIFDEGGNLAMTLAGSGTSTGGTKARFEIPVEGLFADSDASLTFNTEGKFGVLRNVTTQQDQDITSIGMFGPDLPNSDNAGTFVINLRSVHVFNPGDDWEIIEGTGLTTDTPFAGIFNNGIYTRTTTSLGLGDAMISVVPEPTSGALIAIGSLTLFRRRRAG